MHAVATALNAVKAELNGSFLEREDAIEAMCLALVAGEHAFLLGPPGTAKSELCRAFVSALRGASYFETLLSKTRPTEAVLGPPDIKALRENGDYVLRRDGFATDVDVLFLDEVGKMSPILGHDLLALLNERLYHEVANGRSAHSAPLWTAFTASNEIPTGESDDAAALWDRLLFRVVVDYLQQPANFAKLLTIDVTEPETQVDFEELRAAGRTVVPQIALPEVAAGQLTELRIKFAQNHLYPSDRRWRASIKALRASAFLAGREEITPSDFGALRFTLWDTPEQIETVERLCYAAANPFVDDVAKLKTALTEIREGLEQRQNSDQGSKDSYGREANAKLVKVRSELDGLLQMSTEQIPGFKAVSDLHRALDEEVAREFLKLPDDVVAVYLEKRRGLGDGSDR